MLKPKNILITGANRGLGLELVKQFLKLSTPPKTILATCRNPQEAQDLNEVARTHDNVKVIELDVADGKSVENIATLVEPYVKEDGLNLLINNAGIHERGVDRETMMKAFAINVVGPLGIVQITDAKCHTLLIFGQYMHHGTNVAPMDYKALSPYLKQAAQTSTDKGLSCNRAAVVNLTSMLASISRNNSGGMYSYRTSKAALNMLTQTLHVDLKPDGILCFCVHPGWVQTDMGGAAAPVSREESALGLLKVMSKMNANSDVFVDYVGKTWPW